MKAVQEELAIARVKGKSGSSVKTAVIKATRSDGLAPKRKHVQFLVQATKGQKPHAYPIISACRLRLARQDWQVGVKVLTVVHWLINTGGDQFRLAASRTNVVTTQFSDIQAPGYSGYVRDYSKYIESRLKTCTKLGRAFNEMLEDEDEFLEELEIDNVLDLIPLLLTSLQCIMGLKPHFSLFSNQITIASFSIVLKDSIKLYQLLSKALLRVTDEYKTLSKKEAQSAFKSYEKFINLSDDLIDDFFPACSRFTKKLPKFKKIPDSILDALEDYIEIAPKKAPKRAARKKKEKKGRKGKKDKKKKKGRGRSKKNISVSEDDDYSSEEVRRHVERERVVYEEEQEQRRRGGRDYDDNSSEMSNSGEGDDGAGTMAETSLIDFNMFATQAQPVPAASPFGAQPSFGAQPVFSPQVASPFAAQQQVASPFATQQQQAVSPFAVQQQVSPATVQPFSPFQGDAYAAQQQAQLQQQQQQAQLQQQQQLQLQQQQQQLQMHQQREQHQLAQQQAQAAAQQQAKQQALLQQQQYLAQQQQQLVVQQQQQQQQQFSPFVQPQYLSQPVGGFPGQQAYASPLPSKSAVSAFNGDGSNLPALPKAAETGNNLLDDGAFDPFKVINLG